MGMADEAKLHEIQQRMLKHWHKVRPDMDHPIAEGRELSGVRQAAE